MWRSKSKLTQSRVENRQLQPQEPSEFQETRSQRVHVHLKRIAEIDEHVLGFFLPTRNIQASRHDVYRASALDKVLFHGNGKESVSRIDVVSP